MKKSVLMWALVLFLSASFLALGARGGKKGTPDGTPPSEENDRETSLQCGLLQHEPYTSGLYGTCDSYCSAQDADFDVYKNSHFRLLIHYYKKWDPDVDPIMPCKTHYDDGICDEDKLDYDRDCPGVEQLPPDEESDGHCDPDFTDTDPDCTEEED